MLSLQIGCLACFLVRVNKYLKLWLWFSGTGLPVLRQQLFDPAGRERGRKRASHISAILLVVAIPYFKYSMSEAKL